jgi:long-chain acyl-CoA synthetase
VSSSAQLEKIREVGGELPDLERVVIFDPPGAPEAGADGDGGLRQEVVSWTDFLARGRDAGAAMSEETFRSEALSAKPDDTATILYTSGTTGDPKGVMLSHNNLHSNVRAAQRVLPIDESDSTLSFLPLSHVFQRMVDYLLFNRGCAISYARSLETVADDLKRVRPTIVVSVPRLYEKVYARVMQATGIRQVLVRWARGVGGRWADAKLTGREPGVSTAVQHRVVDRLVFSKIRKGVGGRLRYFVSGGAPLSPEINRFFFAAGVVILEGYGLTETSPVTNVNSPEDFPANFRIGTVGKPVAGTEIRIAEDGEILVRGPQVMQGYLDDPEATADVITDDGWFHTGDIGELDEEGFLKITDRKKDIIVTAGGKNVAPQPIENRLQKNRYVDQAVLLGDRRKFLSLFVVPDFDHLVEWAGGQGIGTRDRRELLSHAGVQEFLENVVSSELQDLSRVESPKKIVLLEEPFTIEDGSLTPTQKIKRRVVETRYREVLDALYEESSRDRSVFTPWDM